MYLGGLLDGSGVGREEFLFFASDEHEGIILILFIVGGEFDIGDHFIIELILSIGWIYCFLFGFEPQFVFVVVSDGHSKISI